MQRPIYVLFAGLLLSSTSFGFDALQDALNNAPAIIRVEEDWEIMIAEPLPEANLPQIVTVFGPTDASFGTHTMFEINHGTLPQFTEGGMQLQVWWGDFLVGYRQQFAPTELSFNSEIIRYTTVTRLHDDHLHMEVIRGQSHTFGPFGNSSGSDDGGFLSQRLNTFRTDLNPYDPYNSIRHSRVTYGANRVNRFVRKAIRFYSEDGLYVEDKTRRYVHRLSADIEYEANGTGGYGTTTTDTSGTSGTSSP
ncbi:MAG: hypothetical protein KDA69_11380, partial [Planctomycetaceae bacterium]|nr:hypothetical protein [Planctomycetaceae bacterium]MCA9044915.1 hypothetical protein [Planctomycetaceae bacterium]MCB9952317.1 hypothetical protein [Planctomycetaceae bacterium]